jgi:hypothetical protein
MMQAVYNYPKSSCKCHNCSHTDCTSCTDCTDCTDCTSCTDCTGCLHSSNTPVKNYNFSSEKQDGQKNINPNVMANLYDKNFKDIKCNGKVAYTSTDPRLISTLHNGQTLILDRPPLNSTTKLSTINTDSTLDGYGQNYRTYSDIEAGQIMYYTNKSQKEVFYEPLFSPGTHITKTMYKDPMGAVKPQYNRTPAKYTNPLNNNKNTNYEGKLSWIQDSQEHRQDLMSLQMRKQNKQRWEH